MAVFDITGPDGTKYRISGETAQGAYAALQKHIAGQQSAGDTGGFSEAMAQTTAMPGGPGAAQPKAMPTPSGIEMPGADTSPASAIAAAMGVPVAGHDPRPSVDKRTPPSPPPTPREQDPIPFGMMGGSSDDQVMWARREIARQMAETGEKPVRPDEAALIAAMSRPEKDDVVPSPTNSKPASAETVRPKRRPPPLSAFPEVAEAEGADVPLTGSDLLMAAAEASMPQAARDQMARAMGPDAGRTRAQKDDVVEQDYTPTVDAIMAELGNTPSRLSRGFKGNRLLSDELGIGTSQEIIDRTNSTSADLDAVRADIAAKRAAHEAATTPQDRHVLQEEINALVLTERTLARAADDPGRREQLRSSAEGWKKEYEADSVKTQAKIDELTAAMTPTNPKPGVSEALVSGIASFGDMAPGMAATLVTRNPLPMMAYMGYYSRGSTYADKRAEGVDPKTAATAANLYALAETIPEIAPLHVILKGAKGALSKIVGGAVTEGASEVMTQGLQQLVDIGLLDRQMTWGEAVEEMKKAGAAGSVMGILMGVGGAVADRGKGKDKPATKPPAGPNGASPYRPVTPHQPKPEEAPADPLVAAMSPDAPVDRGPPPPPDAPVDVSEPPVDAQQAPLTSAEAPQAPTHSKDATNPGEKMKSPESAPEGGNFEVMDETETVDGETRLTGRKVRVNLDTGDAEVVGEGTGVSADTTGKPGPVGGAGSQPQASVEDVSGNSASPAADQPAAPVADPKGRRTPQRVFLTHDQTLGITTDPKTFQYKGDADAEGINDRLRGVTRFDPNRAGQAVLFQRRDGTLVVADGHQRTGLARRMADAGQKDVSGMAAVIYREADGYTPQEVMTEAAIKNIGEGSGTAVDAARILRNSKETVADLGLPPNSAMVRTADGLRRLSDQAFGMVANGMASERDGAAVGKNVTDPGLHGDVLALLTRLKPENEAQAAMIARDAASAATTETQDSLFGPEQVQQSLYGERAKVLDHAIKSLGKNIATFRTLVDRAEAITSAGNQLAKKENAARLDDDTRVRQYLTSQANMKGEISDALTEAARLVRSGTPVRVAATDFVRNVQRRMEGGGRQSEGAPRGGSGTAPPVETSPVARPAPEADTSPDGDLLAAMTPTEEPGAEGLPQTVIPGAEGSDDQAKAADEAKRKAEAEAKAQQSKIRRDGQTRVEDEEGNLFGGPKRDLFDEPAKPSPTDPVADEAQAKKARRDALLARRAETLASYRREGDDAVDLKHGSDDLTGQPEGLDLLDALAAADTLPKKRKAAEAWVLKRGRESGVEHLVTLDFDGVPLSIRRGHKSGVSPEAAVWRAGAEGKVWVSIHNHPLSSGLSGSDYAILAIWPKHTMIVMAHNGDRHEVSATAAFDRADEMARKDPIAAFGPLNDAISEAINNSSWAINKHLLDLGQADGDGHDRFIRATRPFNQLIMDELGLIVYADKAKWLKAFEAAGFDFGEFYGQVSGPISDRLRRAGFVLPEGGDRGGNPKAGSSRPASPPGTDRAGRKPAQDGSESDQGGRVPDSTPVAPDDFDSALDDVFGKPEPAPRSSADIAKDLGALFSEPNGSGFRESDAVDQAKYARAVPLFTEALTGHDVASMPRKDAFVAMIRPLVAAGLKRESVAAMRPYFERFLDDVASGRIDLNGGDHVSGPSSDLERDSGDATPEDGVGAAGVPASGGGNGSGSGTRGGAPDSGRGRSGGKRLPGGDAAPLGTDGDPALQGGGRSGQQPADGGDGAAGGDAGQQGLPPDESPTDLTRTVARNRADLKDRAKAQAEADATAKRNGVRPADEQNIRDTLPLLLPEQQDDVLKVERRFAKPDGHGMMITNGTGTGKTYSGGGVIKRFVQSGRDNILILAPSQGILDHWVEAGADLGLTISKLDDTTSAGRGIVATTYANAGMNGELAKRNWDLVVTDEAHKLSQNATGDATSALRTVRAITNRPADLRAKSQMLHAGEWDKARAMKDGEAKTAEMHRLHQQEDAEVKALAKEPRSKVLFLSATPFAYDQNVDYAEGYLFDYPEDGHVGRSRQSGRNLFMVEHFGYRIRYHRLTKPEAAVDSGVFEREFHEKLKRDGALTGRHLNIEPDYDRRFIATDDAQGAQIDGILDFIREKAQSQDKAEADAYRALWRAVQRRFNYLKRMQLLEAIKARAAQTDINKHLAMGRKIVIFHDYNIGGGFNPFRPMDDINADAAMLAPDSEAGQDALFGGEAQEGYDRLVAARPEVETLNFAGYLPPVNELKKVYGDRAVIYNGTIPQKDRAKAKKDFNTDGSGTDIMIVQSAAGEAGISLHDVTGAHQRVLINLGMPTRPTTALQEEGRIRREGSVTDALFHYYTIGTTWERQAFAKKIAERSGTVENLALGAEARTIRESFIEAYEEAQTYEPGEGDGKGGKDRDRARARTTPYDAAKSHYFGRVKTSGKRDQRDGIDFYPTPEPLAFKMIEWAGIRPYERVLEPSAGDGSIARYFPDHADRTIVEPSAELLSKAELRAPGSRTVASTFEKYHIVNKHHVIVMNPPFGQGGKTAIEHLAKAAGHLRPGGRIVALIPTGPAADKRFDAWWDSDESDGLWRSNEITLPAVTFEKAGTTVAARILVIDKVDPVANDLLGSTRHVNLTGANTIGEFFDRLEGIGVQGRQAQAVNAADELLNEQEEAANPSADLLAGGRGASQPSAPLPDQAFKSAETTHAKTGEALFVATATERVSSEAYRATLAVAKRHNGWYSSFRGRGAIPGYQFKSEADRTAFLDDMKKPTVGGFEETAYHGSPHEFDRFSLNHIGSGEGHQAFGWGLYFAGRKEIAEFYKRTLSRAYLAFDGAKIPEWMVGPLSGENMQKTEEVMAKSPPERPPEVPEDEWRGMSVLVPYSVRFTMINLHDKVRHDGGDPVARLKVYRETALNQYKGQKGRGENTAESASRIAAADWLMSRVARVNPPRLYQVDIPEAGEMLDWDERLSKQPESVKDALRKVAPDLIFDSGAKSVWQEEPETDTTRRAWRNQFGWLIVDWGGHLSVISPGGSSNFKESKTLADAKGTVEALRKHYGDSMVAKEAYWLLSSRMGSDRAASEALRAAGIPGHRFLDATSRNNGTGSHNYVIYDEDRVRITGFEEASDSGFIRQTDEDGIPDDGPLSRDILRRYMPQLRAELDRLDLKRVRLWLDDTGASWQGMFLNSGAGGMDVIIGASMDPMKTLHHEVIHILRAMNLFTEAEWRALEIKAERDWVAKYDIEARYPALLPSEQVEEAIAEAFADAMATKTAPKGSLLVNAFNKIARLMRAIRNVFNGAGFQTAEDVFGRIGGGQMTRRDRDGAWAPDLAFAQKQAQVTSEVDRQIRDVLANKKLDAPIIIRKSPQVIAALLKKDVPVVLPQSVIWKASADKHGLTEAQIIAAVHGLDDPVMVFDSATQKNSLVALVDVAGVKDSVVVALRINEPVGRVEISRVVSIHDRPDGQILNWMSQGLVRYVNRKLTDAWRRSRGLQLPKDGTTKHRLGKKILQHRDVFKPEAPPSGFREDGPKFQAARIPSRQARAHMATAMQGAAYIPDRRVWEELSRAGAPVWDRLHEGAGAARDRIDRARIKIQDRFLPVLRAQQAIERATGSSLTDDQNAYLKETTFSGKVGRHLFEIDEDFTKPIIDLIAETKGDLTADDVGAWLYARHAVERNQRIASINPAMPDGGSGMMTADAQGLLAAAAAGPHAARLDKIGAMIDGLRERTLKLREDKGLITHAEAHLWRTQYKHYVPLKGFADTDLSEAVLDLSGVGRRFNTRGPETKRALGRNSEAFNPLQAAITQAQEVSIRAEKNQVGQAAYELARDFPSPALWSVKKVKMKRFYNRTTGLVESRPEDPVSLFMEPNEMAVKVGGEEHRIIFHDPRLARALGTVGADQMGWFIKAMSVVGRWFSMTRTMLNPEFVLTNAFRDMSAAQINIGAFADADRHAIRLAMVRDWRKALVGAYRGAGNKADTEWTRYYREFEKAGGKVSFWTLEQPEAGQADLNKRIWLASGPRAARIAKTIISPSAFFSTRDNGVLHAIERINIAVDNAIRLSAFVAARKRGWSEAQAASLAKNLTVNFNRRGEGGATINALYVFFNASVQGSVTMLKAMRSKKVAMIALGLIAAGFLNDLSNAYLSDEDDDGVLFYDKIPDYESQSSFQFMLGKDSETAGAIPMPYGWRIFPYLGQQIGKIRRGVKEPDDAMADFAVALMGSFSPVNGSDIYSFLMPTVGDPALEIATNRDWRGRPIMPDYDHDLRPDSQKYWAGASEGSKLVADAVNRATGGSTGRSGMVDVSPETIDHLFGFAVGSAGQFWGRSVDLVAKAASGKMEDVTWNDVPFARTVVTETGDWLDRDRYFAFRDQIDAAVFEMKTAKKTGEDVSETTRQWASLATTLKEAEKRRKDGQDIYLKFNARVTRTIGVIGE